MLAQPRPAPVQSQSPLAYTTSTTTTTIVTTTTTTTTTTETKTQTKPPTKTKTLPKVPTSTETKVLPTVPIQIETRRKTGTRVSSAPALPPSPPASIHGSEGEREGLQGREGEGSGLEKDETNDAGGNGIDDHIFPLPQPIARRNTTGSIQTLGPEKHHPQISKSTIATPHNAFPSTFQSGFGEGSVDLASDIYKYSERIRRERNLKRAKQQHREHLGAEKRVEVGVAAAVAASGLETEPSPSATHPGTVTILGIGLGTSTAIGAATVSGEPLDENPLVGNLIGEGHVNYVLMYNMLTGIRIAVSRCGGKMMRPIAEEDFRAEHKYSFDIIGNELTPSAKYDFKFKDYSPFVFRNIRESIFHLDPADYLLSLTSKYILSELGSPGKSGSFFYFSRDYRFIIKTIRRSEHLFLRSVLERYWVYVRDNPQTLISRFYGLHRVKLPRGRKIHFVIMNNLFPSHKDVHATYDLKGSTVGREYAEEKARENPRAVLKDLNWIRRGERLDLGPEKRALLTEQLRRDKEFLKSLGVMDYSLLVGIHRMERGNRDRLRRSTLKVFAPEIPPGLTPHNHHHHPHQDSSALMAARRAAVRSSVSEPKTMRFGRGAVRLPEGGVMGRSRSVRTEAEHVHGYHSRSQSLFQNPSRDQTLIVDEMVQAQVESQDVSPVSSSSQHQRSGSASTSAAGPTSQHIPQYISTSQYSASYTPVHSVNPSTSNHLHSAHPSVTHPSRIIPAHQQAPELEFSFLFYSDEGGLRSSDECNQAMDRIYYLGVIDILTPYGVVKRAENLWKGVMVGRVGRHKISPVPPVEYADRFFAFMKAIMTGGEGGERFIVGGGDYKEKGKEKEAEEATTGEKGEKPTEREGEKAEARGFCRCLDVCRCVSSPN